MSEQKSEEKVVRRTTAILLAFLCIVLAVALAMVGVRYANTNSDYKSLSVQNSYLQAKVNDLTDTVNLAKSTVWASSQAVSQTAGSYTSWTFAASYAGYALVDVASSTTSNTYVEVIQSLHGSYPTVYDDSITVGTGGIAVLPILPGSVEVKIGNTNVLDGASETVTITYYY
jgi:predicted PurR-regulated permease PerM